jgi:hypothetical protein
VCFYLRRIPGNQGGFQSACASGGVGVFGAIINLFQGYFGINSSQNPHTASRKSYKNYSECISPD